MACSARPFRLTAAARRSGFIAKSPVVIHRRIARLASVFACMEVTVLFSAAGKEEATCVFADMLTFAQTCNCAKHERSSVTVIVPSCCTFSPSDWQSASGETAKQPPVDINIQPDSCEKGSESVVCCWGGYGTALFARSHLPKTPNTAVFILRKIPQLRSARVKVPSADPSRRHINQGRATFGPEEKHLVGFTALPFCDHPAVSCKKALRSLVKKKKKE